MRFALRGKRREDATQETAPKKSRLEDAYIRLDKFSKLGDGCALLGNVYNNEREEGFVNWLQKGDNEKVFNGTVITTGLTLGVFLYANGLIQGNAPVGLIGLGGMMFTGFYSLSAAGVDKEVVASITACVLMLAAETALIPARLVAKPLKAIAKFALNRRNNKPQNIAAEL